MQKQKGLMYSVLFFLISLPLAYAINLPDPISNSFAFIWDLLEDPYVRFGLTFIFFVMLLYAVFAAGISRVGVFQGEGGPNKQGRMIALSLSFLASISIFWGTGASGPEELLGQILVPFGIFGGIGLAFIVFAIIYFGWKNEDGTKSWKRSLIAAALAMIIAGWATSSPNVMSWGWFIAFLALIFYLFGEGFAGKAADSAYNKDYDRRHPDEGDKPPKGEDDYYDKHPEDESKKGGWNPGSPVKVEFLVTDRNKHPLSGVSVVVSDHRSGFIRGFVGWRKRGGYIEMITGPDGKTPVRDIPSGNVKVETLWGDKGLKHFIYVGGKEGNTTNIFLDPEQPYTGNDAIIIIAPLDIQGDIEGTVTGCDTADCDTPVPVENAIVHASALVEEGGRQTLHAVPDTNPVRTGSNGKFRLVNLPPRTDYVVYVEADGYHPNNHLNKVLSDGGEVIPGRTPSRLNVIPIDPNHKEFKDVDIVLLKKQGGASPEEPSQGDIEDYLELEIGNDKRMLPHLNHGEKVRISFKLKARKFDPGMIFFYVVKKSDPNTVLTEYQLLVPAIRQRGKTQVGVVEDVYLKHKVTGDSLGPGDYELRLYADGRALKKSKDFKIAEAGHSEKLEGAELERANERTARVFGGVLSDLIWEYNHGSDFFSGLDRLEKGLEAIRGKGIFTQKDELNKLAGELEQFREHMKRKGEIGGLFSKSEADKVHADLHSMVKGLYEIYRLAKDKLTPAENNALKALLQEVKELEAYIKERDGIKAEIEDMEKIVRQKKPIDQILTEVMQKIKEIEGLDSVVKEIIKRCGQLIEHICHTMMSDIIFGVSGNDEEQKTHAETRKIYDNMISPYLNRLKETEAREPESPPPRSKVFEPEEHESSDFEVTDRRRIR